MQPKVSILIPVYNSAQYLKRTIESALGQSWKNIELVIVDDGSSDDSLAIARQFESDNVKVLSTSNQGACNARNIAYNNSSGDFIQYLDGDDILSSSKIENQMSLIHAEEKTIATSRWVRFYNEDHIPLPSDQLTYRSYQRPIELLLDLWNFQEMMQTSVWLTPRMIIDEAGPWDTSLRINQDGEFFGRVILRSSKIKFEKEELVFYRSGVSNSISAGPRNRDTVLSLLNSLLSLESEILRVEKSDRVYKALSVNYSSFIYHYNNLFPDLAGIAKNKLKEWNLSPVCYVGGKLFVQMSAILGFYNTLKLRNILGGN